MARYRVTWSGFIGQPGYSNFYQYWDQLGSPELNTILRTFFEAIKSWLPSSVTLTYPSTVDQLESTTGALLSSVGVTAPGTTTGTSSGGYSSPAGLLVQWKTGAVIDGTRARGRTYLVPFSPGEGTNGQPNSTNCAAVATAANTMIASSSGSLVAWHRPLYDRTVKPPVLTRPGALKPITSAACPTKFAVMRSRRD